MMLVIRTQVYENYAWNEDGTLGTGENAYWKAKGGRDYKVLNVPLNIDYQSVVDIAGCEQYGDCFRETIIDWSIEPDDYLSSFERQQLEHDGEITYTEPWEEYQDVIAEIV